MSVDVVGHLIPERPYLGVQLCHSNGMHGQILRHYSGPMYSMEIQGALPVPPSRTRLRPIEDHIHTENTSAAAIRNVAEVASDTPPVAAFLPRSWVASDVGANHRYSPALASVRILAENV